MPDAVVHGTLPTGAAKEIGATSEGRLQVDADFSETSVDAFGRLRISSPLTLFDSSHRFADNGLWATATATSGSATFNANHGSVDLAVTTASGSEVLRETKRVFAYQPGKSLVSMNSFVFAAPKTGLRQRVGYFDTIQGYFVELGETEASVCFVRRSSTTGSVVETKISRLGGVYGAGDTGWNTDKLDGNGPSGITAFNVTAAQIMFVDLEWLGVGSVRMGFVINGRFVVCHQFHHANVISTTHIGTACLPLRYEIRNTAATASASTLKQICSTVLSEGGYELRGEQRTVGTPITSPYALAVAGTKYPIVSLRLKGTELNSIVVPVSASVLGLGNGPNYKWEVVINGDVTGGSWVSAGNDSSIEYNITSTSLANGVSVASGFFASSNQSTAIGNILKSELFGLQLERNSFTSVPQVLSIAISCDTATSTAYGRIDWEEVTR